MPKRRRVAKVVLERFETRNGGIGQRWAALTEEGDFCGGGRNRERAFRMGERILRSGVYLMDFDAINWKVRHDFGHAAGALA